MQNYFTGSLITKLKPNGFNHQPRTKISKVNLIVFRLILIQTLTKLLIL
jgi:hypothetical protein